MTAVEDFRLEVREWLGTHCPVEMRAGYDPEVDVCWGGAQWTFQSDAQRAWLESMSERGWTVPGWPRRFGGADLDAREVEILGEEMRRINARPPLENFGITMLGPALLEFGTPEQRLRHLPRIANGTVRWCQGFSEPDAGSDLASLRTRAVDMGDHFVVTGQKIWTSYADKADWMFALVRTDPAAKKQRGVSFLLLDMDDPAITTRPIKLISGTSPFCETFFDGVSVPKHHLVGELNGGWDVAKYLLTHEREAIGRGASGLFDLASLDGLRRLNTDAESIAPLQRLAIARAETDSRLYQLTLRRYREESNCSGRPLAERSAILKYLGAALNQRHAELAVDISGVDGLDLDRGTLARKWLRSKGNSIEGGTSEIMLNIISRNILSLPQS